MRIVSSRPGSSPMIRRCPDSCFVLAPDQTMGVERERPSGRHMPDRLVDLEQGTVSRAIYSDAAIYQLEIERIFARCWLFVGHETQIPQPGDYVTTFMGEEPVIVWRDTRGRVHAFLNTCRHRGNRVCLYERGNAASFTCSYHGWTYDNEGSLIGVPFHTEAYYGELDRSGLGLSEVPHLEVYGGMIFATWDAE